MGLPPVIIHFNGIFPNENQPFWATPFERLKGTTNPPKAAPWSVVPCWASAGVPGSRATPVAFGPSAVQPWRSWDWC